MSAMASVNPLTSRFPLKRRTSRLALHQSVGIAGKDRNGQEFTIGGKATNLNLHGAVIALPRQIPLGSIVRVRNNQKLEATMKVVTQTKAIYGGMHSYGVQFIEEQPGFWGITFPPAGR
jgi:hypothetical protein